MLTWNEFKVVAAKAKDPQKEINEEIEKSQKEYTLDLKSEELTNALKQTLAQGYVLYHTAHGFHWNMKGEDFYEYHKLFLKIYEDIYESLDPIAENIVKLGESAPFVMSQLANMSTIKEVGAVPKDLKDLTKTFQGMNSEFIKTLKSTFDVANKKNEQGVANFIAERIDQHQKWDWFLKASLGKK